MEMLSGVLGGFDDDDDDGCNQRERGHDWPSSPMII